MRLRCANDRAADIGNYSLRNSRVHLLRPPLSPLARAFVSYRPSLSFPPSLSSPGRFIFRLRIAEMGPTPREARARRWLHGSRRTGAATLIYKRLRSAR